jgi:hypothetical protein
MLHVYPLDPEGTMLAIRQESLAAERRADLARRSRSAHRRASLVTRGASGSRTPTAWRRLRFGRRGRAVA